MVKTAHRSRGRHIFIASSVAWLDTATVSVWDVFDGGIREQGRPLKFMVGFEKVMLHAGESARIYVTLYMPKVQDQDMYSSQT